MAYPFKRPAPKVLGALSDQKSVDGPLVAKILRKHVLVMNNGIACITILIPGMNRVTYPIGSKECRNIIIEIATAEASFYPTKADIAAVEETLIAIAEGLDNICDAPYRIGRLSPDSGIIINRGNTNQTRYILINGKVEIVKQGNDNLICHRDNEKALPMPVLDDSADWSLISTYLNMEKENKLLIICWIMFVMVTPPREGLGYPILVLKGSQSTGKTFLSRLLRVLIDPHTALVSKFPANEQDLAILCGQKHLQIYDNLREVSLKMSDLLCMVATGAVDERRELYTNSGISAHKLHNPIVLNSIHQISDQQDFTSRCLYIQMNRLTETQLANGEQLQKQLETELPRIYGGLLILAAQALEILPTVTLTKTGRMIDFTKFIAAVEIVLDLQNGKIQNLYLENQKAATMSLVEQDELTLLFYRLAQDVGSDGAVLTPTELHSKITAMATGYQRGNRKIIPANAASLGRKIDALTTPLWNVGVDLHRTGDKRNVYIGIRPDA